MKELLCKLIVFLLNKFHLAWQVNYKVTWYEGDEIHQSEEDRYVIAPSLEKAKEKIENYYEEDDYLDYEFSAGGGAIIFKETNELF